MGLHFNGGEVLKVGVLERSHFPKCGKPIYPVNSVSAKKEWLSSSLDGQTLSSCKHFLLTSKGLTSTVAFSPSQLQMPLYHSDFRWGGDKKANISPTSALTTWLIFLHIHVVAVHCFSQPEMDMPVGGALGFPHPRVEVFVGGGEAEVSLAVGPGKVFVLADFARFTQRTGQVPAVLFVLYSRTIACKIISTGTNIWCAQCNVSVAAHNI